MALFEALKGGVVLVAGSGLLLLVLPQGQRWAERVVSHTHLNPARDYPRIFLDAVERADRFTLALAVGALAYSALRFVEAYGLWRAKRWAEWFAILSGALYLPLEALRFWNHPRLLTAVIFLLNGGVVAYLLSLRWGKSRFSRPPPEK